MSRIPRPLATLVLALVLLFAPAIEARFNPLASIAPLHHVKSDGSSQFHCTAWATTLGNGMRVWATAAHCLMGTAPPELLTWTIGGKPATPMAWDFKLDLAYLTGGSAAQPLQLAFVSPKPLQYIYAAGYPGGSVDVHVSVGAWSTTQDVEGLAVYSLAVAGGMSGSPILDKGGVVVGLMQQMHEMCSIEWRAGSWCPMSRGASTETLRKFLGY